MTFRGAQVTHVYYDELADHTVDAFSYMMQSQAEARLHRAPPRPPIKPLEITCKACGAEPGQRCIKTHRRHGKTGYRGYHFRRKDDARLATEAVRALNLA